MGKLNTDNHTIPVTVKLTPKILIKNYVNQVQPKTAVLAGGGFISLELAENLKALGIDVTIVQSDNQLMNPFDTEMAAFIHNKVRRHGVKLVFGHSVDELRDRLDKLDKSKSVCVICQSGLRSYIACRILAGNGFDAYNFAGGFRFYEVVMERLRTCETCDIVWYG